MFLAVFTTLMSSFADIFWKKSLSYWVGWKMHDLLTYPVGVILWIIFIFSWLSFENVDHIIIGAVFFIIFIDVTKMNLQQSIFREEKYSVIAPYLNISKILIIIWSFFIFRDVSTLSLFITLIAVSVIILFSFDFKTLKLPRNIKKICLVESARAMTWLLSWWLIINYSENLFFVLYVILATTMMSWIVLYLWEYKTVRWLPKKFWFYRYIGGLGWISWFLGLTIISSLWLSISVLLSFLWIWAALLFSFIFMKDKPAKKDIILTLIVTSLVWLWFYFK